MLLQPQAIENRVGIDGQRLVERPAVVDGGEDGDEAAYDVRVAVGEEGEDRSPVAALNVGGEPDLAGAAAHLVGVSPQRFGQRRQGAAELDQIAVAILPIVEQGEVGRYIGCCRHGGSSFLAGHDFT